MKKIIVVDDTNLLLQKRKSIFNRTGFQIFTSSTNEGALEIHRREHADLIVTRLETAGMQGDDLCRAVRKEPELSGVSIIILCGSDEDEIARSSRCQANAVITLPLDSETLIEKAVRLLDIPRREGFRVIVSARIDGTYGKETFFCHLSNISISGMLIESDRQLECGDRISCSFFLPGTKRLYIEGHIVRTVLKTAALYEYGIRIDNLSLNARAVIDQFVKEKSRP